MQKPKIKVVPIDSIKPHPRNRNNHSVEQVAELAESARQFEQTKNIVVWKGTIIAGKGFWLGAKKAKLTHIEIKDVSHWSEAKAMAYMAADNELARKSKIAPEDLLLLVEIAEKADEKVPGISDADRLLLAKQARLAKREQVKLVSDPPEALVDAKGTAPGTPSGQSARSARFPLAIVLDASENRQWQEYKGKIEKKSDSDAFRAMFEAVRETGDNSPLNSKG